MILYKFQLMAIGDFIEIVQDWENLVLWEMNDIVYIVAVPTIFTLNTVPVMIRMGVILLHYYY